MNATFHNHLFQVEFYRWPLNHGLHRAWDRRKSLWTILWTPAVGLVSVYKIFGDICLQKYTHSLHVNTNYLICFVVSPGDSWTVEQLRGKSNEDLHKLWWVFFSILNGSYIFKRRNILFPSLWQTISSQNFNIYIILSLWQLSFPYW